MSQPADDPFAPIAASLQRVLNRHGHGFHYATTVACQGLRVRGLDAPAEWVVRATEFPVLLNGKEIPIDIVLELTQALRPSRRVFVVVECKRTDPAVNRWCFAHGESTERPTITDVFHVSEQGTLTAVAHRIQTTGTPVANIGVELRSGEQGNGSGRSFEEAVAQVLRGAGGFVERSHEWIAPNYPTLAIPLIVTTADLFITATPLVEADRLTGDMNDIAVTARPFIWFEQHVNRSLLPRVDRSLSIERARNQIQYITAHRHRRGIMIATAAGLPDALRTLAIATQYLDALASL